MDERFDSTAEEAAAFQRIWTETASKMLQTAFTVTPNAPPEILQQIRGGIFQALARSWDEFLRSPQFLETMRQWIENAISLRKVTNDFTAKTRNEMQSPSRNDADTILLNIRHLEKRLLDRVDELAHQVHQLQGGLNGRPIPAKQPTLGPRAKSMSTAVNLSRN
ncbi:MAG TPA: hypothetical protein VEC99_14580 [Clostridia bacterium]|nr:hypothetical protein [Clostridia bacterium]